MSARACQDCMSARACQDCMSARACQYCMSARACQDCMSARACQDVHVSAYMSARATNYVTRVPRHCNSACYFV